MIVLYFLLLFFILEINSKFFKEERNQFFSIFFGLASVIFLFVGGSIGFLRSSYFDIVLSIAFVLVLNVYYLYLISSSKEQKIKLRSFDYLVIALLLLDYLYLKIFFIAFLFLISNRDELRGVSRLPLRGVLLFPIIGLIIQKHFLLNEWLVLCFVSYLFVSLFEKRTSEYEGLLLFLFLGVVYSEFPHMNYYLYPISFLLIGLLIKFKLSKSHHEGIKAFFRKYFYIEKLYISLRQKPVVAFKITGDIEKRNLKKSKALQPQIFLYDNDYNNSYIFLMLSLLIVFILEVLL